MDLKKSLYPTSGVVSEPVWKYTLSNSNGMEVDVITYGCIVTDVRLPGKDGNPESVVLGFDDLKEYRENAGLCLGSVVGRIAGRIDHARFSLDGKDYLVPNNDGENSLHGNHEFANAIWTAEPFMHLEEVGVTFRYVSPDGSNGFPGEVTAAVTYTLDNSNQLLIHYEAVTTKDTVLNLTNHTYFNLSGNLKETVKDHIVTASADRYLELREDCIPTGKQVPVEDTPFDFRKGRKIRDGVESDYPQNVLVHHGYDHPFLFPEDGKQWHEVTLSCPASGRTLTIGTDYPCFVMYTGNYIDDSANIRGQQTEPQIGVALETQGYPDAMNHPDFPSVLLRPGEMYQQNTVWHFSEK
jgi:aldose 1-epimerase